MDSKKTKVQISQKLPQFEKDRVLFIVTGRQEGKFFLAHKGLFSIIHSFKVSHPQYSDKEGRFMTRGSGKVFGQGSVVKNIKKILEQEFNKNFKNSFKKVFSKTKPDKIYLFSPLARPIKNLLAKNMKSKIVFTLDKDYFHEHPFDILKAIKK